MLFVFDFLIFNYFYRGIIVFVHYNNLHQVKYIYNIYVYMCELSSMRCIQINVSKFVREQFDI